MATIKDVANEAGVSIGTVSNYLNEKGNVSAQTSEKIKAAIKKLHYVVQNSGRELRQKKSYVLGLVFPNISEPYFEKVISSIKGYMNLHGSQYSIEMTLTDNNPRKEKETLLNYIGRNISGIILYTCNPDNRELFAVLENSKIPFVLVDRRPEGMDCNLIYLDNYNIFHDITKYYLENGYQDIALVTGPDNYDENKYAAAGYRDAFRELGQELNEKFLYRGEAIRERGFHIGIQMCQNHDSIPQIILTTSYRMAEGIRYAYHLNHLNVRDDVRIISTGDEQYDVFYFDSEILKTSRSTYEVGEKTCQLLLENIRAPYLFEKQQHCIRDTIDVKKFSLPSGKKLKKTPFVFSDKIKVLMLDDQTAVSGISNLLDEFYHKTGIEVEIEKVLSENAFSYIQEYLNSGRDDIDVFLFDVPWLHYMAEKGDLLCLDDLAGEHRLDVQSYLPNAVEHFGMYNGRLYALPFMVCTQLLFYRLDIFQTDSIRNAFEAQCMFPLQCPENWHQFNTIARYFTRAYNPNSPVLYGHSMSLSYPEELICALMPRLWECKSDLYDENDHIQCNSKAMRKVVHGLLESVSFSDPDVVLNKPPDALHNFMTGKTAMVNIYYNYANEITDRTKSEIADKYSYSHLPGKPVLAGWSLGIAKNSRKPHAAFRFIQWATGKEISVPHTILGGQSPNLPTYQNYDLVMLYPWLTKALCEVKRAKRRRTPVNSHGQLLNEKAVENMIYEHLRPLILRAVEGDIVGYGEIQTELDKLQKQLLEFAR